MRCPGLIKREALGRAERRLEMLRGLVYVTGLWVIVFKTDVVLTLIVLAGKSIAQP